MTPEEARTKWCPQMAIHVSLSRYAADKLKESVCCIADDCMCWQWSVTPKGAAKRKGMVEDGYCGLSRP